MAPQIKGIVPPPFRMPAELQGERRRLALKRAPKTEVPLLITLFAWYCFLRAAGDLVLSVLAQLAPGSELVAFATTHLNSVPPPFPPAFAFLVLGLLYIMVGWRWITRDWRARWAAMFISGVTAASSAYQWVADRPPAANPDPVVPIMHHSPVIPLIVNVAICCYLAFYPGMADAFKETKGK
jgi:xanthosine utilization system XapX-like protein